MFSRGEITLIAGPCAIESREQVLQAAEGVAAVGVKILRGGAFKPRSSPYSFQGLEEKGLVILKEAADRFGLKTVTEITEPEYIPMVMEYASFLQIGARNMDNFALLKRVGQATAVDGRWVFLKRGFSSTVKEWLLAVEYIIAGGNPNVVLCERGIRTFETATRFTLDLNSIPIINKLASHPVIVDPSHGTGHADMVIPMSRAAVAAGADGLMIEVHPDPKNALCDGAQSLHLEELRRWVDEVGCIARSMGKEVV